MTPAFSYLAIPQRCSLADHQADIVQHRLRNKSESATSGVFKTHHISRGTLRCPGGCCLYMIDRLRTKKCILRGMGPGMMLVDGRGDDKQPPGSIGHDYLVSEKGVSKSYRECYPNAAKANSDNKPRQLLRDELMGGCHRECYMSELQVGRIS